MTLHTVAEVANILKVSRQVVCDLIDSGRLPGVNCAPTGGKRKIRRVTDEALQEFISSGGVASSFSASRLKPKTSSNIVTKRRLRISSHSA